jgi:protoporphyrinogen oxidase
LKTKAIVNERDEMERKQSVIIVGAGPAGLTAALELVQAGCDVTVLERDSEYVGGLARTMRYKEHRFDIGAHRFFTKNTEIAQWWRQRLPNDFIRLKRLTRILYRRRFFDYPLKLGNVLDGLGILESLLCLASYLRRQATPIRPEKSFEDWVVNRFGNRLYRMFFKTYTEKVWGMPCNTISPDWASQRIKGLTLWKAVVAAIPLNVFGSKIDAPVIKTLIDEFDYPRFGAGSMWEKTRDEACNMGARVVMGRSVIKLEHEGDLIKSLQSITPSGQVERWVADEFIVSMPLQQCVLSCNPPLMEETNDAASRLKYRDFLLVVLIVNRGNIFPDNWIYVHDPDVRVGRIENFNNWTPELHANPEVTCLELEYFCSKTDEFWQLGDSAIMEIAKRELEHLGLAKAVEVVDGCVVRVEKAYPVYDDNYRANVDTIRDALTVFKNLQVVGRNGMHRYNNQDHSMLTGKLAAQNVTGSSHDLWSVNTEADYHEAGLKVSDRRTPQALS